MFGRRNLSALKSNAVNLQPLTFLQDSPFMRSLSRCIDMRRLNLLLQTEDKVSLPSTRQQIELVQRCPARFDTLPPAFQVKRDVTAGMQLEKAMVEGFDLSTAGVERLRGLTADCEAMYEVAAPPGEPFNIPSFALHDQSEYYWQFACQKTTFRRHPGEQSRGGRKLRAVGGGSRRSSLAGGLRTPSGMRKEAVAGAVVPGAAGGGVYTALPGRSGTTCRRRRPRSRSAHREGICGRG